MRAYLRCKHATRGAYQRSRGRRLDRDGAGQRWHVHPERLTGCRKFQLLYAITESYFDASVPALVRSPRFILPLTRSMSRPTEQCAMPRSCNSYSTSLARQGGLPLCPCAVCKRVRARARTCPCAARRFVSSHQPLGILTLQYCGPRISSQPMLRRASLRSPQAYSASSLLFSVGGRRQR